MSEINEIFGVQDEYIREQQNNGQNSVGDNAVENILERSAYTILVIGIFASIVTGAGVGIENEAWQGWLVFFGGSISSFLIWARLMIHVNISNNVRQIKHELKKRNNVKEVPSLKKGDVITIPEFGDCKFEGVWDDKYAFYPLESTDLPKSPYLVNGEKPYLLIPQNKLLEIIG